MGLPIFTNPETVAAYDRYFKALITRSNQGGSAVAVSQPSPRHPDASAPHNPLVTPAVQPAPGDSDA